METSQFKVGNKVVCFIRDENKGKYTKALKEFIENNTGIITDGYKEYNSKTQCADRQIWRVRFDGDFITETGSQCTNWGIFEEDLAPYSQGSAEAWCEKCTWSGKVSECDTIEDGLDSCPLCDGAVDYSI